MTKYCTNCGKEIDQEAVVCPHCGREVNNNYNKPVTTDSKGAQVGYGFLGAFIPLVGLILFCMWRKERPLAAKAAGIGALVSVVLAVVITVIVYGIAFGMAFGEVEGSMIVESIKAALPIL